MPIANVAPVIVPVRSSVPPEAVMLETVGEPFTVPLPVMLVRLSAPPLWVMIPVPLNVMAPLTVPEPVRSAPLPMVRPPESVSVPPSI